MAIQARQSRRIGAGGAIGADPRVSGSPGDGDGRAQPAGWGSILMALSCGLLAGAALGLPMEAGAQGWIEPAGPPGSAWVQKVRSRVRVEVEGNVATLVVDEWFQAHGGRLGEADYLYPLPAHAVFERFSLYLGDEEIRGEVMDAEQAREIYEAIVRKRRDPALIELAGQGLLRARVFPLSPGETRRVTLRFSQLLERAGDALQLRYEGGVPSATACSAGGSAPPSRCNAEAPPVEMEIRVSEGGDFLEPFSPTHSITAHREGPVLVVKSQGSLAGPFSLFLPLAREGIGLTLVTHKPLGEDGYFLLSLSPGRGEVPAQPRDLTVVLDVSGSMSGEKIRQARAALLNLLETLSEEDRFRLIAFSNAVRPFDLAWRSARPADRAEARGWVSRLEADGGTNISGALAEALRLESPSDRLPVTIFLTDGLPTVGETSVDAISQMVESKRGRTRVFAFGVGPDVNTALLDRMTEEGRGSTGYVEPGESVERALSLLANKIRYPVLTDLALVSSPARLMEVYPVQIPDVFAGEELIILGRYETRGEDEEGRLVLEGIRGGAAARFEVDAEFPRTEEENAFLPRLWASRKLGFLTRRVWTEGETKELVDEIRRTALRYGLPSPYTSYLVMEPGADVDEILQVGGVPPFATMGGWERGRSAPTEGAAAVDRAKEAKVLREVGSVADLVSAQEEIQGGPPRGLEGARWVQGRLFQLRDGVWTEMGLRDDVEVVWVQPFSRAYFDLLDRIPELKGFARELPQLEIQGQKLRIRITDGGEVTLSPGDLREIRGRFISAGGER